jgi:hypothetical protein
MFQVLHARWWEMLAGRIFVSGNLLCYVNVRLAAAVRVQALLAAGKGRLQRDTKSGQLLFDCQPCCRGRVVNVCLQVFPQYTC